MLRNLSLNFDNQIQNQLYLYVYMCIYYSRYMYIYKLRTMPHKTLISPIRFPVNSHVASHRYTHIQNRPPYRTVASSSCICSNAKSFWLNIRSRTRWYRASRIYSLTFLWGHFRKHFVFYLPCKTYIIYTIHISYAYYIYDRHDINMTCASAFRRMQMRMQDL